MKIKYDEDRYISSLGVILKAGEELEVPDDPFAAPPIVVEEVPVNSSKKSAKNETVVNDGSAPQ